MRSLAERLIDEFASNRITHVVIATSDDLGDFVGRAGFCHENAKHWVDEGRGGRVVAGFLQTADYIFVKHSVVEICRKLLDITPREGFDAPRLTRFVRWDRRLGDEDFERLSAQVQVDFSTFI